MATASVHRTSRRASRWYLRLRRRRAAAATAGVTAGAGAAIEAGVDALTLSPRASIQSRLGPPNAVVHGEGLLGHPLPGEVLRAREAGRAETLPQWSVGQGPGERVGQCGGVARIDQQRGISQNFG